MTKSKKPDRKQGGITPRQRAFVDRYIETDNQMQSAIDAGYSPSYAKSNVGRILRNKHVKAYYDQQYKKLKTQGKDPWAETFDFLHGVMTDKIRPKIRGEDGKEIEVPNRQVDRIRAAESLERRFLSNHMSPLDEARIAKLKAETEALKDNKPTNTNIRIVDAWSDEGEEADE